MTEVPTKVPTEVPTEASSVATEAGEATWRYAAVGVVPTTVARPTSVSEIQAVVRDVRGGGKSLIPVGKGARLGIGRRPRRYDVALSLDGVSGIESHRAADLTVTVRGGTTLRALNRELASFGQTLPLDPAVDEQTTIGGLIAVDANGPRRLRHGKVRDWLLGVRFVNGLGEQVRAGGNVVKNVAGYDVGKVLIGSFGTLGVLTEATFKVRPIAPSTQMLVWECSDLGSAVEQGLMLDRGVIVADYLEALNDGACEAIGFECEGALVIGLAGAAAEVAAQSEVVESAGKGAVRRLPSDQLAGVEQALRNFSLPIDEDSLVARISVLPTALPDLLRALTAQALDRGVVVDICAHAASGVARCQLIAPAVPGQVALLAEWLRVSVQLLRGWVVFEAIPEELRDSLDPWGYHRSDVSLMRQVKEVFDPDGVLSPGRFVGGI